jgi:hypothetical protein
MLKNTIWLYFSAIKPRLFFVLELRYKYMGSKYSIAIFHIVCVIFVCIETERESFKRLTQILRLLFLSFRNLGTSIILLVPNLCSGHNIRARSKSLLFMIQKFVFHIWHNESMLDLLLLSYCCCCYYYYINTTGIALGYGLDDRGSRVRFPARIGNFSLHHRVQNGSGAHPASSTRALSLGIKRPGREAVLTTTKIWSWVPEKTRSQDGLTVRCNVTLTLDYQPIRGARHQNGLILIPATSWR